MTHYAHYRLYGDFYGKTRFSKSQYFPNIDGCIYDITRIINGACDRCDHDHDYVEVSVSSETDVDFNRSVWEQTQNGIFDNCDIYRIINVNDDAEIDTTDGTVTPIILRQAEIKVDFMGGQSRHSDRACNYMLAHTPEGDELYAEYIFDGNEDEEDVDEDAGYDELKEQIIEQAKILGYSADSLHFWYDD